MAKKFLRAFALLVAPFLASLFIRFLYATNKKNFYAPLSIPDEPTIFACWHGELLMLPCFYSRYRKKPYAKVLISSHFDGMLISKTISYLGLGTITGSTNRNATRVLMQSIRAIKDGYDIGITPDGPKGPRHEVANGIIAMAQKAGVKIVLVEVKPTKYWQLNSWDRFTIPKPFGTLNYYVSSPIDVSGLDMRIAKETIQEGLKKHEE